MVQVEDLPKIVEEPEALTYHPEKETLLSKYKIPVHYLDYDYVEQCQNGKELEKIYHILKSGQEGYFPDLIQKTEEKLTQLKPNSKLLRKICPVLSKDGLNKHELNNLSKDLADWVDDVNKKDHELENRKIKVDISDAAVRRTNSTYTEPSIKSNPKRISSTDYNSWDKYDPDTEILKMDLEDEKVKKESIKLQQTGKKQKMVRFNNFATEAEAVFEANRAKERGNECFKAGELEGALFHYSNSLTCKPLAPVYTNRALIYNKLKKFDKALNDCKSALKIEPKNFKAHLRMAQSYDALKQYDKALEAVEKAIEIDPNNEIAQELANRMRKTCGKTCANRRLMIEDVEAPCEKINLKPILKNSQRKVIKLGYEIIAIPGTSRMPPPYYKVVYSDNPEIIKREKQRIFARPMLLHITTIDVTSDDEQPMQEIEPSPVKNRSVIIKIRDDLDSFQLENFKFNDCEEIKEEHKDKWKICKQKPDNAQVVAKGGGGEPYNDNRPFTLPSSEELQSPYTFIECWNSIRKDTSYKYHAEIIKKLDLERMPDVIGYKLDDVMLSNIISCLYRHFMVPSELDRLHTILTYITYIPRFSMTSMFLSESDWIHIRQLIEFLDQHGRGLPNDIRNIYLNH